MRTEFRYLEPRKKQGMAADTFKLSVFLESGTEGMDPEFVVLYRAESVNCRFTVTWPKTIQ